jgi:hypothetical protein
VADGPTPDTVTQAIGTPTPEPRPYINVVTSGDTVSVPNP